MIYFLNRRKLNRKTKPFLFILCVSSIISFFFLFIYFKII